ncbi:unnamed protein product [Linum trigynum]|uniref:Uncharacterized protein n=1 Tax=Linum trigynum TaxID=586398 RepID=A0AAV2CM81_9ROSI
MLSTVVNENPLPAPTLFPSDRPPDTAISISDPSPCSNLEKAIISDTDMIVESPEAQPQSTQAPEISLAAQIPQSEESGLHRDEHSFNVSKNEEIQIREGAREENFTDQVQPSEAAASMVAHEGQEIKIQVPRCIAHSPRDYRMDRGESSETRRVDSCG